MTAYPAVSIVIPCYNQSEFLPAALRSVHRQQYPGGVESIVVDDGSQDRTAAVAASRGATIVQRQRNRGLAAARNAGLARATGEYIIFLDADDELMPDAAASGASVLARTGMDGVLRCCRLMNAAGEPLPTNPPEPLQRDLYVELLGRNITWTPGAAVFRRSAVTAAGGFPEDVSPAADYALYLALARSARLLVDRRDAVWYRQHDSNMSRDPLRMLRATLTVLDRERPLVPSHLRAAYRAGRRAWCAFYGEQIVELLRVEWRGARRTTVIRDASSALLLHCRETARAHAAKKLWRMARGLPPTEVEPSRFSPASGRPGDA